MYNIDTKIFITGGYLMINYLWDFVFFSFIGWCTDEIYYLITEKKIANRGFLTSPFSPMYGFGAVIIDLVFYSVRDLYWAVLIGSILLLGILKFLTALFLDKVLHFKMWDYTNLPLNIKGYICVPIVVLWGFVALVLVSFVMPIMKIFIILIPTWLSLVITLGIIFIMLIDTIGTFITIFKLQKHLKEMDDVSKLIEEDAPETPTEELKEKYNKLMLTNNIFRRRLVNAFPDMQSVSYAEHLANIRVRLNEIKESNLKEYENIYTNEDEKPFAYGLNFNKLFWLFIIGSFCGTVLETIWAVATLGHFEFRVGLVYGPFIPVYGGGAVLITLCLYKLYKAKDVIIYIASAIIGAAFEFFCSYFQEMFFGTVSWDYSDTPFNIQGRTNLMFALIWGFLGLVWVRYLYPWCSKLIEKIPKKIGNRVTIALVIFMIFDVIMTCAGLQRADERSEGIPATNVFAEYLDEHLDDDYLQMIFPHMTNVDTGVNVGDTDANKK